MPHSVRSVLASALLLLLTLTAEAASAPDAGGSTTSPVTNTKASSPDSQFLFTLH
jgi:hypothetical protein